ncbi:hypothetical protein Nepgr_002825 [Nepenthes gracilis]|uniref:Uncharacterized protein n=1 Tax=Nepenthes gracilis TaxID=150966 RepID=A0AAD3P6Y2_NEPGR|nr:hypothetical protein Nepgr_002825 [Nepenthes gracilis]
MHTTYNCIDAYRGRTNQHLLQKFPNLAKQNANSKPTFCCKLGEKPSCQQFWQMGHVSMAKPATTPYRATLKSTKQGSHVRRILQHFQQTNPNRQKGHISMTKPAKQGIRPCQHDQADQKGW